MALMPWQAGRKPASKPVSSSRLGNQNRGQPVTNSQLGVKLLTNQRFPFFAPTLSLYIFPGFCWQVTPDHVQFGVT